MTYLIIDWLFLFIHRLNIVFSHDETYYKKCTISWESMEKLVEFKYERIQEAHEREQTHFVLQVPWFS